MNAALQKLTCKAKTPDRSPCQAHPIANSGYCFFHDPNTSNERKLASQRGGKGKVTVVPRLDIAITPLRNNEQILASIETVIAEVRGGIMSPRAAKALGYSLNVRLHCLPIESAPPAPEQRSERFRELEARVIENSIKKAKAYGHEVPEPWRELSEALDDKHEDREPTIENDL